MSKQAITPEERFGVIVDELAANPSVTPPETGPGARRRFGASALKVHGKVFAMVSKDNLILKLPASRVEALITSGAGERWEFRRDGRAPKEWVAIPPTSAEDWLTLAREAMEFVGA